MISADILKHKSHCKLVILGDPSTGKSKLIQSLQQLDYNRNDPSYSNVDEINYKSTFSTLLDFSVEELHQIRSNLSTFASEFPINYADGANHTRNSGVFVRAFEYSNLVELSSLMNSGNSHVDNNQQETACKGALFTIITIDIRDPKTAESAFNKWLKLKREHMNSSFLIIVGTFADYSATSRRVKREEICKACAMNDAIYIEIDNSAAVETAKDSVAILNGVEAEPIDRQRICNTNLLRRLIAQRLQYMLDVREELHNSDDRTGKHPQWTEEIKIDSHIPVETDNPLPGFFSSNNMESSTHLNCETIGAILDSVIDACGLAADSDSGSVSPLASMHNVADNLLLKHHASPHRRWAGALPYNKDRTISSGNTGHGRGYSTATRNVDSNGNNNGSSNGNNQRDEAIQDSFICLGQRISGLVNELAGITDRDLDGTNDYRSAHHELDGPSDSLALSSSYARSHKDHSRDP
jgi:hypothetical protein